MEDFEKSVVAVMGIKVPQNSFQKKGLGSFKILKSEALENGFPRKFEHEFFIVAFYFLQGATKLEMKR